MLIDFNFLSACKPDKAHLQYFNFATDSEIIQVWQYNWNGNIHGFCLWFAIVCNMNKLD